MSAPGEIFFKDRADARILPKPAAILPPEQAQRRQPFKFWHWPPRR